MKDEGVESDIIDAISHLSTALRMNQDQRDKGRSWEIRCAVKEVVGHTDGVEVEFKS